MMTHSIESSEMSKRGCWHQMNVRIQGEKSSQCMQHHISWCDTVIMMILYTSTCTCKYIHMYLYIHMVHTYVHVHVHVYTVEPPKKGHFGGNAFVSRNV